MSPRPPPPAVAGPDRPASAAPSEALGVLRDTYDRIFVGGYITGNGATQSRLVLIHG